MADEDSRTIKEKLLFYTTAFFILLGTFSLFAFLFLVPFVIEPAFTTIFMQFDTRPALCVTAETVKNRGVSNCTWSSCREGCTKELFECIQIHVNYKAVKNDTNSTEIEGSDGDVGNQQLHQIRMDGSQQQHRKHRRSRGIREYDYDDNESYYVDSSARLSLLSNALAHKEQLSYGDDNFEDSLDDDQYTDEGNGTGLRSEWFLGARLFPNVKGCGYPPSLNCTIWTKKYKEIGTNFSCYYSKVDPALVISDLDMWQNTLNLVYSMAIPIPSFIISVIYLTVAYFKIYNEDEEQAPLDKNAEEIADDDELGASSADCCDQEGVDVEDDENLGVEFDEDEVCIVLHMGSGSGSVPDGLIILPEDANQQSISDPLPVGSRESTENGLISNSGSIPGNLSKTMTTSISTPPGPIAAV